MGISTMSIRPAIPAAVTSVTGPDAFRAAMRQLAGGVSVITVGAGIERSGMTATSVSALSLDPPTLIVCVNRHSSTFHLLQRYRAFGVNILRAGHEKIAERFTGRGGTNGVDRYAEGSWITLVSGTVRAMAKVRTPSSSFATGDPAGTSAISTELIFPP
jgi:flavin reductase (DIM6/NTAB) family NADH-FMN oxidoreductase RutF